MKHVLHIMFNEFRPEKPTHYVEIIEKDGLVEMKDLKRRPRSARFDIVEECGCGASGSQHVTHCTRKRRVYGHPLAKH